MLIQKLVELRINVLIILNIILQKNLINLLPRNFEARLKQANLGSKVDFDNKLISFNKKITSNKTKYLEVPKKLNSLTTKDQIFYIERMYFTNNDGSQNAFAYQPTLDTLKLK